MRVNKHLYTAEKTKNRTMLWEEGQLSLCLLWFPGHSVEGKPMYSAHTEYTRYLPTASGVGSREAYKI